MLWTPFPFLYVSSGGVGPADTRFTSSTVVTAAPPSPITSGTGVVFTATITTTGSATGTVQFYDGATPLGSAVAVSANAASTPSITTLTVGSHSISSVYSGDGTHQPSTSNTLTYVVNAISSTIAVTGVPASPTTSGTGVVFTGTITTTGTATGTVQFQDGGVNLGSAVTVASNAASTPSITTLSVATHTITGIYSGDATHSGSTSSGYTHTVSAGGGGDITTGLIHHWPMTDGQTSGGSTNDIVGSLNLSLSGGVTSTAGPNATYATGRALDGTDNTYLSIISLPFDWNSGSFSVTGWAWISNPGVAGPTSGQRLMLSDDSSGGNSTKYINLSNSTVGKLIFGTAGTGGSGGTYVITTPQVFPSTPAWVHFAVTNTGGGSGSGGTKVIYINGSSVTTTSGNSDTSFGAAGGISLIGSGSATDGKLTGKLASFRVYSRALSAADVTTLYNGGAGG